MADAMDAIRSVRRAASGVDATMAATVERYKPTYVEILEATSAAAGDEAVEDLAGWLVGFVEDRGRPPSPREARERARAIVREHGGSVPADSALWA